MRRIAFALAVIGASTGSALAGTVSQTCKKGGDARLIEVVTPGVVGRACDLKVTRDGGSYVSTPYHADNSAEFCAKRASDMISSLAGEGYSCGETIAADEAPPVSAEVAQATAQPETVPMQTAAAAAAPREPAPEAPTAATPPVQTLAASEPAEIPEAPGTAATPPSLSSEPAPSLQEQYAAIETAQAASETVAMTPPEASKTAAPVAAPPPQQPKTAVLEQPPATAPPVAEAASTDDTAVDAPRESRVASAGPTALAPTEASVLAGVRPSRPSRGLIVGATPEIKPVAVAPDSQASEDRLAAQPVQPLVTAAGAPAAAGKAAAAPQPRATQDVIKSVLAAQAAAWNEGDLEAYMGVYWRDQNLRLVSGSTVSNGWKETMKFYRDRYGDSATMGRLSFDRLEVDMVTPEVATVYGRYRRDAATGAEAGSFTLVMKRLDGLWRIVSDHTVPDPATTN